MNKPEWCATMYRKDGSKYVFCKEALEKTMVTPKQREASEKRKQEIKERTVKEYKDFINKTVEEDKKPKKSREEVLKKEMIDTFKKINPKKLPYTFEELKELLEEYEDTAKDYELYTDELKNLKRRARLFKK